MKRIILFLILIGLLSCKRHSQTTDGGCQDESIQPVQMPVESDSVVRIDTTAKLVLKYDKDVRGVKNLTLIFDKIIFRDTVNTYWDNGGVVEWLSIERLTKLYSDGVHTYIMLPFNYPEGGQDYKLLYYVGNKLVDTRIFPLTHTFLNDIDEDGVAELMFSISSGDEPIYVDTIVCSPFGDDSYEVYKLNGCDTIFDAELSAKVTQVAYPLFIKDTVLPYWGEVSLSLYREDLDLDHHTLSEEFEILKKNKILYPDSDHDETPNSNN